LINKLSEALQTQSDFIAAQTTPPRSRKSARSVSADEIVAPVLERRNLHDAVCVSHGFHAAAYCLSRHRGLPWNNAPAGALNIHCVA
jgi:hypothetical protein